MPDRPTRRRGTSHVHAAGAAGAVLALSSLGLAGCAAGADAPDATGTGGTTQLTLLAAASLRSTLPPIVARFEQDHPGVKVRVAYDGSAALADQVIEGAPGDVLASADEPTMQRLQGAGEVAEGAAPRVFATNHLVLVTPPDNPGHVTGLDSSLTGIRLVVCEARVPCGRATHLLAEQQHVTLAPVSEETSVTDVLGKVRAGEADAGLVYTTDARAVGSAVRTIDVTGADRVTNRYPVAPLRASQHPDLARQLAAALLSPAAQRVLAEHGFGPP